MLPGVDSAPVSLTEAVSDSVSRPIDLTELAISLIDAVTCCDAEAMSWVEAATCWIDAAVSWIELPVSAIDTARLAVLAVTWSIDAAISLTDEPSSSAEAATDSAWPAVSVSEAAIWLMLWNARSSASVCVSAPSDTSSLMRAIAPAVVTTCSACDSTCRVSKSGATRGARPFDLRVAMVFLSLCMRFEDRVLEGQRCGQVQHENETVADVGDRSKWLRATKSVRPGARVA